MSQPRDSLLEILQQRPRPLYNKDLNLALFWSPKSGCTFAVKWFFDRVGLLEAAYAYDGWIHKYRRDVFERSETYRKYIKEILAPETTIIKVVRNPYDRIVSSYIHAIKTGYSDREISIFSTRKVNREYGFSFSEFVDFLGSIDLRACNPHHQLQIHPSEEQGLIKLNYIVHLENSFNALKKIELDLGLRQSNFSKLSSSHHHTVRDLAFSFCGDKIFCTSELKKNSKAPSSQCFYNSALQEKVKILYEVDFRAYNYDLDIIPS